MERISPKRYHMEIVQRKLNNEQNINKFLKKK